MASDIKLSNAAANLAADAVVDAMDGGTYNFYDGTKPASADTGLSGNTLLATVTLGTPAFGSAVAGVATGNATTADGDNDATGIVSWFRAKTSGGATMYDGTAGASGCDANIAGLSTIGGTPGYLVQHGSLTVTSHSYTHPKS